MSRAESLLLFADVLEEAALRANERLRTYRPDLARATGLLPNRQLAPLDFTYPNLFQGLLGLANGGTGADLSLTGPGVPVQLTSGANFTVGGLPFPFIDFSAVSVTANELLVADGLGGAAFGVVDLTSPNWRIGVLPASAGGTGVNNGTRTLTITTNGGTLLFSASGKTLTIPDTGTAALLGLAQTFAENNAFSKILRAHVTSGTTGYGIRFSDGSNDFGNFQALDLGGNSFLFFGTNRYYDGTNWQQLNTRAGGFIQITADALAFNTFPVSSSTPTARLQVSNVGDVTFTGFMQMTEVTAPAAGAANTGRLFLRDNGAGKTQLCIIFNTGAIQVIATQP